MAEAKTYSGGCHCGEIKFEISTDLAMVVECNCSICSKRGAIWTFVKAPEFKMQKGEATLADYQFGKKRIHHLFCPSCGVGSYSNGLAPNGEETYAVNVRCLDGVDVASLNPKPFDGKSL
jgi:hypothetical protein